MNGLVFIIGSQLKYAVIHLLYCSGFLFLPPKTKQILALLCMETCALKAQIRPILILY